ncbi:MAG TPA: 50S ribosomal protein L13 [Methanospirillum sp.]|nr:50S ribosomal protein L13 [Methanospirillum sp.]
MVTVIDGEGLLIGRLASIVAKRALDGEEIAVINAEKAVISGSRARVFGIYKHKRERGSREGGPFFPRRPDHILKRTIRGMLPYKRPRGIDAMKRIRIYVGIPYQLEDAQAETLADASKNRLNSPAFVTLGTVSTFLGAKF